MGIEGDVHQIVEIGTPLNFTYVLFATRSKNEPSLGEPSFLIFGKDHKFNTGFKEPYTVQIVLLFSKNRRQRIRIFKIEINFMHTINQLCLHN